MADIYKVDNCWSLNARNQPSMNGTSVKWYQKGDEVRVYATSGNWYNTSDTQQWWVYNKYVTKIGSDPPPAQPPAPAPVTPQPEDVTPPEKENTDEAPMDTILGNSDESYSKLLKRYLYAFGSPPRYTKEVDPYYDNSDKTYVGRAMLKTWFSDPAILSICPGTVDYLPGFSSSEKEEFWNRIVDNMTDGIKSLATKDKSIDLNGKLYEFRSAYTDYINVVNLLARQSANYMGIGNVSNMMTGKKIPFNKFDYAYYTDTGESANANSLFEQTKKNLNTAVSDGAYIHFFVNQSGSSVNENINTEAGASMLETYFGADSGLSQAQRNIQFLFGGAIGGDAQKDIDEIIADIQQSNSSFLSGFTTLASNYLKGGRLVFPKMITGVGYDKAINVQLQFTSVYGDKRSIFKYTILPALHLLALSLPKQLSDNMYTYPFLCRVYQRGVFNCDLSYIQNLDLKRGGSDDTSWTVDGLPTEITATFQVVPLYSNMMVTSSRNPFLAMNNTALMEYLGTLCGLDLKANNLNVKVTNALQMLKNSIVETPTNLARGVIDSKLLNHIRNYTQIIN